ncbi:vitamin K epoxide reductase family protein [Nocardioides sp. LHD-245]|uniref:vitamin K epoxide reductase family protein n=1 Tax=Nocardioides sp. LHD-245 TaxID=3051387 RepID=UPI0027DF3348|nr:vitamin K epoxide reductase family protein [Nocardioides sp. LHD-245]
MSADVSGRVGAARAETAGDRALAVLLLAGGLLGLTAAFVLVVEKIALLGDASYTPSCSLNPVLDCGSIMTTAQAEVLGFPNPLLGIAAFPVLTATGAALLAGARLARWYWAGLQAGVTLGLGFVCWLIFQSLYRISALCPYCMVVWAVVLPVFWYVTLRNARAGLFGARVAGARVTRTLREWHLLALTVAVLVVLGLIAERFWYYWRTLL